MWKKLRAVAALAMVPVVLLASPASATAGPWVTVSIDNIGTLPGTQADCTFSLAQAGPGMPAVNVGSNGYCVGGPDITPGYAGTGEAGGSYTITVSGTSLEGGSCGGYTSGVLGPHPSNGISRVAGSIGSAIISTGEPDCAIAEVCMELDGSGVGSEVCTAVDLPALEDEEPPPGTSACPYGTPRITINPEEVYVYSEGSSAYNWRMLAHIDIAGETPPGVYWTVASYVQNPAAPPTPPVQSGTSRNQVVNRFSGQTTFTIPDSQSLLKSAAKPPPWFYGFEISTPILDTTTGSNWNTLSSSTAPDTKAGSFATVLPPLVGSNYGGWTDAEHCRFWIGPKQFTVEGTEGDEPSSQVNEPPPTVEDPEEPVLDPPPVIEDPLSPDFSWLWSILDAIRRGIVSLASAIAGLASAIVQGIKDGLKALFIPDTDNWKIDEVRDELEAKPPFSVVAEGADQANDFASTYSSASSCGVLATFGDTSISCDSIRQSPGMGGLYTLVSAGLIGITAWGAILMVQQTLSEGS